MNTPRYKIKLTEQERECLKKIISDNNEDATTLLRANILLLSDNSEKSAMSVVEIAKLTGSSRQTVTKIRNIYYEDGFEIALHVLTRNRNRNCMKHSSEFLENIKTIISEPPKNGRQKWTFRSLSQECIDRKYVEHINPTTIMRILKENDIKL